MMDFNLITPNRLRKGYNYTLVGCEAGDKSVPSLVSDSSTVACLWLLKGGKKLKRLRLVRNKRKSKERTEKTKREGKR